MQVVSLLTSPKNEQLRKDVVQVKKALLGLPKLRLLTCPVGVCEQETAAVVSIVGVHRAKWQHMYSQGNSVVYRRILETRDVN